MNYFLTYRRDGATKSSGVPLGFKVGALNAPKTLNFGGNRVYQNRPKPVSEEYLKTHAGRLLSLLNSNGIVLKDENGREIGPNEFKALIQGQPLPSVTVEPVVEEAPSVDPSEPPGSADEQEPEEPLAEQPVVQEVPASEEVVEIKPEFELKQIHIELQADVQDAAAPELEPEPEVAAKTEQEPVEAPASPVEPQHEEPSVPASHVYMKEELDQLPFNDVRALAKSLGLQGGGTRKVIIERILESQQQG